MRGEIYLAKLRWISASLYLGQRILRVDKSSTMRRTSPWQPNWASRRQDLTSQSRWTVDARHNGGRRGLNSPWPWSTETSPPQEGSCFLNIIPSLSHYSSLSKCSSLPTNRGAYKCNKCCCKKYKKKAYINVVRMLYYWLVVLAIGALIIGQSIMPMMPDEGRRKRSPFSAVNRGMQLWQVNY